MWDGFEDKGWEYCGNAEGDSTRGTSNKVMAGLYRNDGHDEGLGLLEEMWCCELIPKVQALRYGPRGDFDTAPTEQNVKGDCPSAPGGNSDLGGCSSQADCEARCNSNANCLGFVDMSSRGWGYMLKNYVGPECLEERDDFLLHKNERARLPVKTFDECKEACQEYRFMALESESGRCSCEDEWPRVTMYGSEITTLTYPIVACPTGFKDVLDANECESLARSNGASQANTPSLLLEYTHPEYK